ncbi:MAG: phosphoglucosamine mutase [Candidatus Aureabacteria bacterium]|nr:phosphoglucosamine mutase [Candidatus Auribacterota bacterium]
MMKLFGTDGVRGVANTEPMTVETALKLGRAAAYVFRNSDRRHRIVIGKDTRLSGYMLENALVAGICSMGVDVLLIGPLPTPGTAFITRSLRADAGIMISASHNPYEDNGIKFFSRNGCKLPDRTEERMEKLIASGELDSIRPTALDVGKAYRVDDAQGRYVEFVKNSFPKGMVLDGLKIVLDCANGAGYRAAPRILMELGAQVIVLNTEPDGTNINRNCGSLHPEIIAEAVPRHNAHVGISLDGDADRVIMVDEEGQVVDGDHMMGVCALDLKESGALRGNCLVATVMSNYGLEKAMKKAGITMLRVKVGDRYVTEEMLKRDAALGGEQSGHIIFGDYTTTGDGMITTLQMLRILRSKETKLSLLRKRIPKYPQVLVNIVVQHKKRLEDLSAVTKLIRRAEKELGSEGRVLVRYSGTENIARVMIEGRDASAIQAMADKIGEAIRKESGAGSGQKRAKG